MSIDDEAEEMRARSASLAFGAAGRLNAVATIILVILSLLAVVGAALGTALLIRAGTSTDRWYAGGLIAGSVLAWLSGALTCFGCQAIARYIEFRVDAED